MQVFLLGTAIVFTPTPPPGRQKALATSLARAFQREERPRQCLC
jgi:hypothetical protein